MSTSLELLQYVNILTSTELWFCDVMIDKKFEFRMPLLRRRTRVKKNIAKHFIVESNESNQSQSSIRDLIFSTEEGPAGLLCLSLIWLPS